MEGGSKVQRLDAKLEDKSFLNFGFTRVFMRKLERFSGSTMFNLVYFFHDPDVSFALYNQAERNGVHGLEGLRCGGW